jgi:hypothetical protein
LNHLNATPSHHNRFSDARKCSSIASTAHAAKPDFHVELCGQLSALMSGETDPIASAANTSALLFHTMPDLNWAGFYFLQNTNWCSGGFRASRPARGSPLVNRYRDIAFGTDLKTIYIATDSGGVTRDDAIGGATFEMVNPGSILQFTYEGG